MKAGGDQNAPSSDLTQITGQVRAFEKVDGSADCKDGGGMKLCITPLR